MEENKKRMAQTKKERAYLEERLKEYPGYTVIYLALSGSKLHGTDTPCSDTDLKGIFIPSLEDMILGKDHSVLELKSNTKTRNDNNDIDITLFSIKEFLRILNRGDINAIELLLSMKSEYWIVKTDQSNEIEKNIQNLIVNKVMAFTNFAMQQAVKYTVKGERLKEIEDIYIFIKSKLEEQDTRRKRERLKVDDILEPIRVHLKENDYKYISLVNKKEGIYLSVLESLHNVRNSVTNTLKIMNGKLSAYGSRVQKIKESKTGVENKSIAHAVRAVLEGIELQKTGLIIFPLKDKDLLKRIKLGEVDINETSNFLENKYEELIKEAEQSSLPQTLNVPFLDTLALKITKSYLNL